MTRLMGLCFAFVLAFSPAAEGQTQSQAAKPQATKPQTSTPKAQAPKAQAPAQPQIRFGIAGPFTGQNAAFGAQLKNGAEQAIADINAAGGILNQKIGVSIGDDASDARQGVSVANKFASTGVKFVIGHFNSGVTIPASDVYMESAVLMVSPSST